MMMPDFIPNLKYETIIDDLLRQKYSVSDNFFSDAEVNSLRDCLLHKYNQNNFKKSAIGNLSNEMIAEGIRGDFILWMDEKTANREELLFFEAINQFVNYINRTCYLGIFEKEFHYALYPEGTFYKRHLDTFQNDSRRKLSVVCYLNDENWQEDYGGELVIYTPENQTKKAEVVFPKKGRVVIFESQILEHEVKPVKKPRLSITGWLKTR